MSFYMSVMINEAIASKITKILSLQNMKICSFDKMHPIQPNEIFFQISLWHILAKSRSNVFLKNLIPNMLQLWRLSGSLLRMFTKFPPKWRKISKIRKRYNVYNKISCILGSYEGIWRQSCCHFWRK